MLFSAALILAFLLYSNLLEVIQKLLETGNIRFLFNAEFIETLQKLLINTYPANSLASIALGVDLLKSILIVIAITIVGVGERGVKVTLGKVSPESYVEGIHIVTPFIQKIYTMDVKTQKKGF